MKEANYLSEYFLKEVWPRFIYKKSETSEKVYFSEICLYTDFMKKDILLSTEEDCLDYMEFLEEQETKNVYKHSTVVKKHKMLSSLFTFILSSTHPFDLPNTFTHGFAKVTLTAPKEEIPIHTILTVEELDKLIGYLKENDKMCLIAVLFSLKLFLKTSEFIDLKISDILYLEKDDMAAVQIRSNNSDPRYNKIPDDFYEVLVPYIEQLPAYNPFLFGKEQGTEPYSIKTMQNRLSAAFQVIEISPGYTFNQLRNSGIAYARVNGAPVKIVSDAIGMKTSAHIKRIADITMKCNDASDFVNIIVKK